jgi:hypothetical protein
MTFGNSILAGEELVRTGIRSPNFVAGVSGWRIARDGSAEFNNVTVRGTFRAQNAAGSFVEIGARPDVAFIDLQPPNGAETYDNATIYADGDGIGTPLLQIQSPIIVGQDNSAITMYGENTADGLLPQILLRVRGGHVDVLDGDLRVDGQSVGRGLLPAGHQVEITNDGPFTVDAATDFLLNNMPCIDGRTYALVLQGLGDLTAATGAWQLNLEVNGVYADTFSRLTNETGTATRRPMNGTCLWTAPSTGLFDFTVMADERAGTADLTLVGGNSATSPPRSFAIYDIGVF